MSKTLWVIVAANTVAAIVIALALLHGWRPGGNGPSVAACTQEIVAHPKAGPWPHCDGLTREQLRKATADAMAQGATG